MKIPHFFINYIFNAKDKDFPYQVDASEHLKRRGQYYLNYEIIIYIIEEDYGEFDKQNIRFFDKETNGFFKLPKDFYLEINSDIKNYYFLLLINSKESSLQINIEKHISQLEQKVKTLSINYNKTLNLIENIMKKRNISDTESFLYDSEIDFNHTISNLSLDIGILYACPLVYKNMNGKFVSYNDPLDFQNECLKLKNILERLEKRISIRIDIGTIQNFVSLLSQSPTVIHLICNGKIFHFY